MRNEVRPLDVAFRRHKGTRVDERSWNGYLPEWYETDAFMCQGADAKALIAAALLAALGVTIGFHLGQWIVGVVFRALGWA